MRHSSFSTRHACWHAGLILLASVLFWPALAAAGTGPLSFTDSLTPLHEVPVVEVAAVDRDRLLAEDAEREAEPGVAPRFAIPHEVRITPQTHGRWESTPEGMEVWRKRIAAAEARSLNLTFGRYRLPEGAELHLFSEDGKRRIRPFTVADNKPHGELWTPVLEGGSMVLELQVPSAERERVELDLSSINYGYRGFFEPAADRSGSCNVDVVCPEGDDWPYEISSVAVISTGGSTFCSGFMVNNVEYDGTPYFMTADHCGIGAGNAASLVTYWNFEHSECREPGTPGAGGPGDGTLDEFNTGSTFRAADSASDFTLVELDDQPDPAWEVGYAGWDARDQATDWAIAIHHPRTQEKRISFEFDPTTITTYLSDAPDPNGTHLRVNDWDVGTTEPGSSGSPLFSPEGRVVGQLHGGYAACSNNDPDWYGRIAVSWEGTSASNRLRDWLDPEDTGTEYVDGLGQGGFQLVPETETISQCSFADVDLGIDVEQLQPDFDDPVTLSVSGLPSGVSADFTVNPVTTPGSTQLDLTDLDAAGTGTFVLTIEGAGGDFDDTVDIPVTLADDIPGTPAVTEPDDGAVGVDLSPVLEWSAASQAASYELEIATDPDFVDTVYTATSGSTSHEVEMALDSSSFYYLRVRATNACDTGAWSPTTSFGTAAEPGDCPIGTAVDSLLFEDFGDGQLPDGWSTAGSSGNVTWVASSDESFSSDYSMFAENIASVTDQRLATPEINLPDDAEALLLTFQNWQHIESSGSGCWDGGLLEISTDGGSSWDQVTEDAIQVREYDGIIGTGFSNPLDGMPGWCGDPRDFWERYSVDLAQWAGEDVSFRFRFGTDSSVSRVGWYVDSVRVAACIEEEHFVIGGTVSGLEGTGLVLQNNGGDDLTIDANGEFEFDTALGDGESYDVTVGTHPENPLQTCSVSNGSGVVEGDDVSDILVECQTETFSIGGTVSGLESSGLVLANGDDQLQIDDDGAFTFPTELAQGESYDVVIASQPNDPLERCSVSNGAGTVDTEDIDDVVVLCELLDETVFDDRFEAVE